MTPCKVLHWIKEGWKRTQSPHQGPVLPALEVSRWIQNERLRAGLGLKIDNRRWSKLYQHEFELKDCDSQLVGEIKIQNLGTAVYVIGAYHDLGVRGSLT